MTTLAAVHAVMPDHRYPQVEITAAFAEVVLGRADGPGSAPGGSSGPGSATGGAAVSVATLQRLHANARVDHRHLALPLDRYHRLTGFTEANDCWLEVAQVLATAAVDGALTRAGIAADAVDLVMSTTTTGLAVPSLDARIAGPLGLRADVKRVPLFGLGCVAGAAGVARLHDYLLGHPDEVAVLVAVELCSLTVQRDDRSMANLVASGLFGDGAAAVVAVGARYAERHGITGPTVVDSRSHLYPDTQRTMGWDMGEHGLRVVLDASVPDLVRHHLGDDVRGLLAEHGLTVPDVTAWVSHPGGPKVIEAIEAVLELPPEALEPTWRSLAAVGNLSSVSVLHVLQDTLLRCRPPAGSPGVMLALGPGFGAEVVLLCW